MPLPQFRCFVQLPNLPAPKDGIVDTGAPLTCVPQSLWIQLRPGIDFEWLPFAAGFHPPPGRTVGWQFGFEMARFLVPLVLMDYTTRVDRPDVVAQFAASDPPADPGRKSLPPIILGLWGGVLEGGRILIDRDPATGSVRGALEFP